MEKPRFSIQFHPTSTLITLKKGKVIIPEDVSKEGILDGSFGKFFWTKYLGSMWIMPVSGERLGIKQPNGQIL